MHKHLPCIVDGHGAAEQQPVILYNNVIHVIMNLQKFKFAMVL